MDENYEDGYYTYIPEENDLDDEHYAEAEQHYEEIYATYLDARRQMANMKASRGFYPVVALADNTSLPSSPSSQAHDLQSRKARASQRRDAKDLRPGNPKVDKYKQEDKLPQSAYAAAKQAIGQPIAHRDLRDQVRLQRAPMHPHRTLRAKRPKLMALQ